MPQVQLTELQHVFVKVETVEGTDAVPVGTDALQLVGPAGIVWGAEKTNPRDQLLNGFIDGQAPLQPAALFGEVTLRLWVRGRGAAYAAGVKPEVDPLEQALGQSVTTSFTPGTEFYKYDTASVSTKTVTIYGFEELETGVFVKHVLLAARAVRKTVTGDAGGPVVAEYVLRGLWNAVPADASDVAPTYLTQVPPLVGGASTWGLGGVGPVVRSFSLTMENTLKPRFNVNAATAGNIGLAGYAITKRKLGWGAVIEAARVADYDPHTDWKSGTPTTPKQLLIAVAGGAAGAQYNRVKYTLDKCVLSEPPALNDEDGLRTYQLTGQASPDGTNRMLTTFD